jgi:hypothetical protein
MLSRSALLVYFPLQELLDSDADLRHEGGAIAY